MDFKSRFNNRRHCDVKVVVDGSTFYLHRFPLEAASTFFDERFGSDSDSDGDNQPARPARPTVELQEFPGGAPSFESVARYVHIMCWRCCRVVTTTNGLTAPTRQVLLRLRCGAGLREHRTYVCCGEVPWNGHTPRCAGLCLRARWRGAAPTASVFADKSEKFFVDTVLQSPRAAATVLKVATSLQFPSEDVMVDVGACACRLAPALAAACS